MAAKTSGLGKVAKQIRMWAGVADACQRTDRELLRAYVACKDEAAFAGLVRRHGSMVLSICRRILHHEQDAEDAFQATFLVLACKAKAIRKHAAVGSWLYGVALRVANKLRLSQARRRTREAPLADTAEAKADADLSWRDVQAAVFAAVDRLPEKYRAPILLCYLQGKLREEAALPEMPGGPKD